MIRAAVLVWLLLCQTATAQGCSESAVFLKGDFGEARFSVEVADDEKERSVGLMHRTEMPRYSGMLFVYDRPQTVSFWMRNTLIELDMLFLDPTGVVRRIHHRARPLDETPIFGGNGVTHVLEINGGMARRLGLAVGDVMRHPSFAQSGAVWPC